MKASFILPLAGAVALWCGGTPQASAQTPPAAAAPATISVTETQDLVRAYLQIQEQLHATQLALERNRQDAEEIAGRNILALTTRLNSLEKNLDERRVGEMRALLTVAGVMAGCGLLALFLISYLHLRALNRFAEVALGLPLNQLHQLAAGGAARHLLGPGAAAANARLAGTIERLEQRIRELEAGAPAQPALAVAAANGAIENSDVGSRIEALLAKGQTQLGQGQAEEAAATFDAALALDPKHAEALIKKGAALEKLSKLDEAIACYDRAIAADSTVTIAYLYKGGVFNRLERYTEALACYELALKTQEKAPPA